MAVLPARGAMQVGDSMVHESIIGSRFTGGIAGTTTVAGKPAIGATYPTGYALADTWGVSGTTAQ